MELLKAGPFWSQGAVALVLLVNEDNYLVQLENGQHKINSRLKDLRRKVQTSEQGATARVGVGRWSRHCSPLPSDPPSRSPRDEPGLLSFAEAGREAVPRARPAQPCLEHASRSPRDEPGVDSAQPLPSSAGASPQPSPSSTDAGFSACGGEQLAGHPAWTQPSSLRPGSIAAPQAGLPQVCIEQTDSPQHGGFSACGGEQPSPQHVSFSACGGEQPAGQHARTQPNCLGFDEAGGNAAPSVSSLGFDEAGGNAAPPVSSAQRCPAPIAYAYHTAYAGSNVPYAEAAFDGASVQYATGGEPFEFSSPMQTIVGGSAAVPRGSCPNEKPQQCPGAITAAHLDAAALLTRGRGRSTAGCLQAGVMPALAPIAAAASSTGLANGSAPASDAAASPPTLGQAASELLPGLCDLSEPLAVTADQAAAEPELAILRTAHALVAAADNRMLPGIRALLVDQRQDRIDVCISLLRAGNTLVGSKDNQTGYNQVRVRTRGTTDKLSNTMSAIENASSDPDAPLRFCSVRFMNGGAVFGSPHLLPEQAAADLAVPLALAKLSAPLMAYSDDELNLQANRAVADAFAEGLSLPPSASYNSGYHGVVKYMRNRKISYKVKVRDRLSCKQDNRVVTGGSHGTAEQAALTRARLLRTSDRYFEL